MNARENHFMPSALLDSQIATLEPPGPDEQVITVNLAAQPTEVVAEILHELGRLASGPAGQKNRPGSEVRPNTNGVDSNHNGR
jgi:gluconokinase